MRRLAVIICSLLITLAAQAQDAAPLLPFVTAESSWPSWTPLSLSPWAWYKADGNATDSSGNGRNGTFTTPIYTNGVNSQAFFFNAAGYVGTVTNRMAGALTVAFWLRLKGDYTSSQYIISDANVAGGATTFGIRFGSTDNEFEFFHNNSVASVSSVDLHDNNWHHVAAVRSGSAGAWTITWYLDGALDEADNTAVNPAESGNGKITIGRVGDLNLLLLKADVDDVLIFTNALTPTQIGQIYDWRQ